MDRTATIELLTKQTEAWDVYESPLITELGYGGAAGGGKTRLGWYIDIDICENYFDARCVVGRKELKTLRLTTLEELWVIFSELGYKDGVDYKFNGSDNIITFLSTGSEILLLDMALSPQDPEYTRFGSLPVTSAWIDESNESPDKGISILKTRVGRANRLHKVVIDKDGNRTRSEEPVIVKGFWLETFNPNKGRVHRDYYKPWKNQTLPHYRRFIRALPGDNHHLSQQYMDNLNRSDKITRERLLKGNFEFDNDPLKLMNYEAITDMPLNALGPTIKILPDGNIVADPLKDNAKYLIGDIARFGGDKIVLGVFKNRVLYRLGVYTYQGIDETVRLMKEICNEESIPFRQVMADEDGVGGGVVDLMNGIKGFHGNASPTKFWDTLKGRMQSANYQNLRSQCYFMLSETVNEHGMSIKLEKFDTNIEGYIQEQALLDMFEELDSVKQTELSLDGKKAVIPKSEMKDALGRSPDFADILMMRMAFDLFEEEIVQENYYPNHRSSEPAKNKAR